MFACPTHHRLLEHACPACGQPAHHRVGHAHILPLTGHPGLHPAQCRAPVREPTPRRKTRPCGARLDHPRTSHTTLTRRQQRDLIDLQPGLLDLLFSDNSVVPTSAGQITTPQRYIVDLRILVCLITASWPAARSLLQQPVHARLIDDHVQRIRDQIRTIRDSGRDARELALYDTPPLDAPTCAVLLALAENLLACSKPIPDHTLQRLINHTPPGMQLWMRQFLAGDGYCSPALHTVLGVHIGLRHICERVGYLPRPPDPAPRPVRFEIRHIPQHLLPEWYAEHLERFATTVKPRLLRRAAAAHLAQTCLGGRTTIAAQQLGIPRWATKNALTVVDQQLHGRSRHAFDTAVEALTDQLNATDDLTDFGARRQALHNWAIPHTDWNELTRDLREKHAQRHSRWPNSPFIDWDDSKRLLASIWIWTRITHGEHIFAPAIRPDPDNSRPGGPAIKNIHSRWPHISAEQPRGHYLPLRERIDKYANRLTRAIDSQAATAGIAN